MTGHSAVFAVVSPLLVLGLLTSPLHAQEPIGTPDVDLLARTIQAEIEAIRWRIGRPFEDRPPIPVEDVAIRENFRQAMTLWRKVNQLGIELVGGGEPPPIVLAPRGGRYGPAEVHQVLLSVLARLQETKAGTGIVGVGGVIAEAATPPVDPSADPSDVFQSIVQSNRQVNRMLANPIQPGDVYQQVLQAIFYSTEILTALDDPDPFPTAPAYERGITPGHVYGRLLGVFDRLSSGFDALGLEIVRWAGGAYTMDESLTPSDVYDLATLLLSELEYLNSRIPDTRAPMQVAHPGYRVPSDVYQQAGILASQASRIMLRATQDPDLLRPTGRD